MSFFLVWTGIHFHLLDRKGDGWREDLTNYNSWDGDGGIGLERRDMIS